MSNLDLSKLTPAPWDAQSNHDHPSLAPQVNSAKEKCILGAFWLCHPNIKEAEEAMILECEANCEFVALARNAFDVAMRRGWTVERISQMGGGFIWRITPHSANDEVRLCGANAAKFKTYVLLQKATDPFTALVEADRWYKENVEKI
jgi:hypothetical protein